MHRYALHSPVTRIKLWTPGGRIAYSDEHALIGKRFPLGADEREILAHGGVAAASSDLSRPENRYERGGGDLLEVYLPIRAANGRRLLFESYQRYSSVATGGERVWLAFAPVLVGGLLLLLLFQLPLARSLVRRLRAGQAESERLLRTALEASGRPTSTTAPSRTSSASPTPCRPRPATPTRRNGRASRRRPHGRARPSATCARCWSTSTRPTSSARAFPPRCGTSRSTSSTTACRPRSTRPTA